MIPPHDDYVSTSHLSRAWGAHLSSFRWDHVVHFTTSKPTTVASLLRRFLNRFVRRAAFLSRQPVPYFYSLEQRCPGHPHLHGLIAGTATLSVRDLERRWEGGFSRITQYDPARGGAFYVSKSVPGTCLDYGLSKRLPPRRLAKEIVSVFGSRKLLQATCPEAPGGRTGAG